FEILPKQQSFLIRLRRMIEDFMLWRAVGEVKGVIIGQLRLLLGVAPGRVRASRKMSPVKRVPRVKLIAGLEFLINTWVEKPFIPPFLSHTFVFLIGVEIDSRDKGESPLAVHDYAVVVVFEFIPLGAAAARDFYSKRPDGG